VQLKPLRKDHGFRFVIEDEGKTVIEIDGPAPFSELDHFTIFWRGVPSHSHAYQFVNASFDLQKESLGTLFYFATYKQRFAPRKVKAVPSSAENGIIDEYAGPTGEPEFVRYEVYSDANASDDLYASRYVVWAVTGRQTLNDREIGVFTTLIELKKLPPTAVADLITKTISLPISHGQISDALGLTRSELQRKVVG
jgi:hypothetical protein